MPHILFVTTSNLATNPRLVKEVELAISLSYKVSILAFRFDNWSAPLNETIRERLQGKAEIIEIPAGRKPFIPWFLSSLLNVLCRLLVKAGLMVPFVLSQALQKRTILLLRSITKFTGQIDLVVAHNPGSFYPVMRMAQQLKIPYGIDVEDYHPGETNNPLAAAWMRSLMVHTIPGAAYVTAASPLIMEYVKRDCGDNLANVAVVLNYFPSDDFQRPIACHKDDPLRMVWFSQYVAADRGLEKVIEAIKGVKNVELYLYGNMDPIFQKSTVEGNSNVFVNGPLRQRDLHKQLAHFDVGLALEPPARNINSDSCISNKLLAYFQAGLFIFATNTSGQSTFLKAHPNSGLVIPFDVPEIKRQLIHFIGERSIIREQAAFRFHLASEFSAEKELMCLGLIWKQIVV